MKPIIIFLSIVLFYHNSIGQVKIPDALLSRLERKTNFLEIKSITNDYFDQQLNLISSTDSVAKKRIMRQKKIANRKLWIDEFYTDENGDIQNKVDVHIKGENQIERSFGEDGSRNQLGLWTSAGPSSGNQGIGRVDEIAFHPTIPNVVYAGTPHGGLFVSLNGGVVWNPMGSYLPALGVSGIAIDHINTNVIYVLSGDGETGAGGLVNAYLYKSIYNGVYKSVDGGANWFKTASFPTAVANGHELIIHPTNPQILLAATDGGVFRTNDGGNSWTKSTMSTADFFDVKFKPGDPNIVYACSTNLFYKSTDGGVTFTPKYYLPNNRASIGVTPANPNKVILLAGPVLTNTTINGVFASTDSGDNFNLIMQTPNLFSNTIGNPVYSDQSVYDNCVTIDPTNENHIIVGGLCVWESFDGGVIWYQTSAYWSNDSPYMHPDIHEVIYSPNGILYCGNDGGVYFKNGTSWTPIFNGLSTSQFYKFEINDDEDDLWGGCQDNGILKQDAGALFENYAGGDGYDVLTDHPFIIGDGDSDDVYFSLNSSIVKDCIGGQCDISLPNNVQFFANLAFGFDEDRLYAGYGNGLWYNNDAGDAPWLLRSALSADWAVSSSNSQGNTTVYFSGNATGLKKYTGSNQATVTITPPAPYTASLKINTIKINPSNINEIYICAAGTAANAKVFYSNNGGSTWSNWSFNLPNIPIFSIERDGGGGIYAGTTNGIFYKRANTSHWERFNNNLPPVPITEIEVEKVEVNGNWVDGPKVYCSTFGRGLWVSDTYTTFCQNYLTLTGDKSYPLTSQAAIDLSSFANHVGGIGQVVKYSAGNKIILGNGFRATEGIHFKTYLQGCNEPMD